MAIFLRYFADLSYAEIGDVLGITEGTVQVGKLTKELELAKRLEEHARKHLKTVDQKVKYAAAIREVDERERQRHGLERPLKELEARLVAATKEQTEIKARRIDGQTQFDELHQIFMSEHENQVKARGELGKKRKMLNCCALKFVHPISAR